MLVPDADYTTEAESPVPLDGLVETDRTFAFAISEALAEEDLDGDPSRSSDVLVLRDRLTGAYRPIGGPCSDASTTRCVEGRAVGLPIERIHQGIFAYAALAVQDDLVAFLQPDSSDANGNGKTLDSFLRIFRAALGEAPQDITPQATAGTADVAPEVAGRSLAWAGPALYFRTAESSEATEERIHPFDQSFSSALALSRDARFLAAAIDDLVLLYDRDEPVWSRVPSSREVAGLAPLAARLRRTRRVA